MNVWVLEHCYAGRDGSQSFVVGVFASPAAALAKLRTQPACEAAEWVRSGADDMVLTHEVEAFKESDNADHGPRGEWWDATRYEVTHD